MCRVPRSRDCILKGFIRIKRLDSLDIYLKIWLCPIFEWNYDLEIEKNYITWQIGAAKLFTSIGNNQLWQFNIVINIFNGVYFKL